MVAPAKTAARNTRRGSPSAAFWILAVFIFGLFAAPTNPIAAASAAARWPMFTSSVALRALTFSPRRVPLVACPPVLRPRRDCVDDLQIPGRVGAPDAFIVDEAAIGCHVALSRG